MHNIFEIEIYDFIPITMQVAVKIKSFEKFVNSNEIFPWYF